MASLFTLRTSVFFFILGILVCCRKANGEDVFASTAELRMLYEGEVDLIDALKSYIVRERQKLDELNRLVVRVDEDRRTVEAKTLLTSRTDHPVYVFHLIYRFTKIWKEQILWLIYDSTAVEEIKAEIDSRHELFPTNEDYEHAKSALIRLQKSYELNVADVINGTILEHTTRPMTQQMAVDVAMLALDRNLVDDAILWFTHAQKHHVPPLTPLKDIYHTTSRIRAQKGRFLQAVDFARKALEIDPTNGDYLRNIMPRYDSKTTGYDKRIDEKQYRLCRQSLLQTKFPSNNTLFCFYERGRLTPMLRTKMEMVHQSPDVVMIHDFLTDRESAELRRLAESKMQTARVGYPLKPSFKESIRVGKVAWLYDNVGDSLVDRVSKRISETTGLETKDPFAEALQMSNYGLGGHYSHHYDHDSERFQHTEVTAEIEKAGDRIATFMIYLNHVEAGGATVFPNLNLGIRPVKNAAVFWYNYKRSGFQESLSLHAGCPVLIGEKWVANKWIREFGQEFRRRCDLSIDI